MNCTRCGTLLTEGDRFCPQCGAARELVLSDFYKLKEQADGVFLQFRSREISGEDYRTRMQGLMLSDPVGVHWKYDPETSGWSCFRNGHWQDELPAHLQVSPPMPISPPPLPPSPAAPVGYSPDPQPPSGQQNKRWILPGVLGGVFLILGYIVFAWFMSGYQESRLQGEFLEATEPDETLWMMALTEEQLAMRDYRGAPEAFTILFYQEEQEDGSILDVRLETWTYYSDDTECTFYNGRLISEEVLLDHPENVIPTNYLPEQFPYRLSAQEVAQAAGVAEYLQVPLDFEFIENGRLYYTRGLTWGVTGSHLTFVQALALQREVVP